ncbi:MAG: flagellar protein FlaG [Thiobacillus sp.]|nr:flagellar protein FlaG [Thiobacillus sp.]
MKDIVMIIQNTPHTSQAVQPDVRAHGATPVKAVAATPAQNAPPQASVEELKRAVTVINNVMQQANLNLQFSVDTDSKRTVVKMVDTSTGELIRQYPSETTLAISRGIDQFQQGLLLTQKA